MSTDPAAIEREMDEARQRLAGTIDQLLHRTSPKTIASRQAWSAKAHFVDPDSGQPRSDNILKAVGAVVGVVVVLVVVRKVAR